ncbi:MAG TPA: TetR/AcrR family transcriptional regulator [Acidimicrobiales bacterium]|jgi:AcrR family transcriptional regulator|nr:TetR/AcrR family transcriptional regulator [Acidimicrobiales bacterium]
MDPEARVAILKGFARQVFAERGYSTSGLAEIAERAKVSKTLLYHYFPDGRPEIMAAVMDGLLADLMAATTEAIGGPAGAKDRIRGWVEAFVGFFVAQPDGFRLLFREPWGSGDPLVTIRSFRAMVDLSRQLADPLGLPAVAPAALVTAATGAVGFVVAVTEQVLAGQVESAAAAATASDFIIGGLSRLRPPAPGAPADRSRTPPRS